MTQREFNRILRSLTALSPAQLRRLRREVDAQLERNGAHKRAEETAFDVLNRAGLIGCLEGAPRSPTDLGTNPRHMEGFGCD